ncbi:DUF5672 family protein [Glaesserella sp.]|uniref:DUF5672 family protein n=1 Tax=Glaesserella sp. TaxID=2094731 RepID=UPI0035A0C3FE
MSSPTLTIASVTGHQGYAQGSVYAIETSFQELQGRIPHIKCLLISPERPDVLPDHIQHIPCQPFSYFEYNLFMIYGLGQLIETDFCLVVQHDGWVINGNNWRDEFFEYDYIGAPLPDLAEIRDNQFIRHFNPDVWLAHKDNAPEYFYEWQNGGFSLRSRKLLNAPRELGLTIEVAACNPFQSHPLTLQWDFSQQHIQHAEDLYFSAIKRSLLEQHGMKFAPRHLAAYFSVEFVPIQQLENIPLNAVLGAHFTSRCTLIGIKKVQINAIVYSLEDLTNNIFLRTLAETHHTFEIPPECNKIEPV